MIALMRLNPKRYTCVFISGIFTSMTYSYITLRPVGQSDAYDTRVLVTTRIFFKIGVIQVPRCLVIAL